MDTEVEVKQTIEEGGKNGSERGSFLRGVFSDNDTPSSSRILMFILALLVCGILIGIFRHVCAIKDTVSLGMWLSALPVLIASLVGLISTPYLINRGTSSITDVLSIFKKQ